jgi:hypothetical protein
MISVWIMIGFWSGFLVLISTLASRYILGHLKGECVLKGAKEKVKT